MLGAQNSSKIDEFFTRGRHEKLDVYYIIQSYFGLLRQSIRNSSDRIKLFKQRIRDVESMYKENGGNDIKYDELKEMCRKAWNEKLNYLCIDTTENKNEGNHSIFNNESQKRILNAFPKVKLFSFLNVVPN